MLVTGLSRKTSLLLCLLVGLIFVLAACGDPEPVAPTATPEAPAPFIDPTLPPPTPVTLGEDPATPIPPTAPPTSTPSQAIIERDYSSEALTILSKVISAPEITDAVTEAGNAGSNALFGGTVDTNALINKFNAAAKVVSDAGEAFASLTPPDSYKDIHNRTINVFKTYDTAFSNAESAVNSGDWFKLASVVGDLTQATSELTRIVQELGGSVQ